MQKGTYKVVNGDQECYLEGYIAWSYQQWFELSVWVLWWPYWVL